MQYQSAKKGKERLYSGFRNKYSRAILQQICVIKEEILC